MRGFPAAVIATAFATFIIASALFTTLTMEVSPFSRSISSGAYNFARWSGAAVASVLSGLIGEKFGLSVPFFIAAFILLIGWFALRRYDFIFIGALQSSPEAGEGA